MARTGDDLGYYYADDIQGINDWLDANIGNMFTWKYKE